MDTGSSSGGVHDDIGEGFPAGGAKPHCEAGGGGGGGGYKMIRQNKTIIIIITRWVTLYNFVASVATLAGRETMEDMKKWKRQLQRPASRYPEPEQKILACLHVDGQNWGRKLTRCIFGWKTLANSSGTPPQCFSPMLR